MSEDSMPLDGLPPADRTLLVKPPLELAIAEVRFSSEESELAPESGLRLYERLTQLGLPLSRIDPMQQHRVQVNFAQGLPLSPTASAVAQGWQLHGVDGTYQVTLTPGAIALQTSKYLRWSETMRPKLEVILAAVAEQLEPVLVNRLGLRYVDRFVDLEAQSPSSWVGHINEHMLGPVSDPELGRRVKSAQQQVEVSLGASQGAVIRHGPIVDPGAAGSTSYMLDIDMFDVEPQRFSPPAIVERLEVLNRSAASLFQLVLTPDYLRALQAKEDASSLVSGAR